MTVNDLLRPSLTVEQRLEFVLNSGIDEQLSAYRRPWGPPITRSLIEAIASRLAAEETQHLRALGVIGK